MFIYILRWILSNSELYTFIKRRPAMKLGDDLPECCLQRRNSNEVKESKASKSEEVCPALWLHQHRYPHRIRFQTLLNPAGSFLCIMLPGIQQIQTGPRLVILEEHLWGISWTTSVAVNQKCSLYCLAGFVGISWQVYYDDVFLWDELAYRVKYQCKQTASDWYVLHLPDDDDDHSSSKGAHEHISYDCVIKWC